MALLLGARFVRSFHDSPPTFQFVKNVYKEIGYQAPFTEKEKQEALHKLNTLTEKELSNYTSKRLSKMLDNHREKNGKFECIEQLLDLNKVETYQLEKVCEKLLEDFSMTDDQKVLAERSKVNKPLFSKGIIPKPDITEWNLLSNPTVLGITMTIQGIAYTKIDSKRSFHGWGASNGIEHPNSSESFQHKQLFSYVSNIVTNFPEADYYIFEEVLPILPKDPYLKQKVNLLKLRSTMMTLMMMRKAGDDYRVHTIKPSVLDTLFRLKDETYDPMDTIDNILHNKPGGIGDHFNIQNKISEDALNVYKDDQVLISKSLLKGLAFNYLISEAACTDER